MFHLGASEILFIVILILVLFGSARFPKIMENLAKGLKTFKKSLTAKETKKSKSVNKKIVKQSSPTKKQTKKS